MAKTVEQVLDKIETIDSLEMAICRCDDNCNPHDGSEHHDVIVPDRYLVQALEFLHEYREVLLKMEVKEN